MLQYPRMLYKTPPARPGKRADMRVVKDQAECDQALASGWHLKIEAADEASGFVYQKPVPKPLPKRVQKPKPPKPVNKLDPKWSAEQRAKAAAAVPEEVPQDDAPVTREELEAKATELGIPFNGRTSNKKLSGLIATALQQGG
ncbi:hypothetical protein UFOVP608_43 [uncultured Caudovirales phage]|uniref:Uncharacterized protein n=1 Tax=uncultured Caudovirales phage TaxID=2100421 RepID=A0A6J5N3M2_9CAUD|nr:hypothetical protein UFOVP608_43 [uncultured Caudovirales phage]